jgi:hypothetical protein
MIELLLFIAIGLGVNSTINKEIQNTSIKETVAPKIIKTEHEISSTHIITIKRESKLYFDMKKMLKGKIVKRVQDGDTVTYFANLNSKEAKLMNEYSFGNYDIKEKR